MPGKKRIKLSPIEFGTQLLETNDLDPVYNLLEGLKVNEEKEAEVLLAYWLFYHLGTVSFIVDSDNFWEAAEEAVRDATHPRGTERRHMRGANGLKAISYLRGRNLSPLELLSDIVIEGDETTLDDVLRGIKPWSGFGPWIGFKMADMLERLGIAPVRFKPSDVFKLFDTPRKGAETLAATYGPFRAGIYLGSYNYLITALGDYPAPPRYERKINIQEVETILCKWKSHLNGHYEVGKDTKEIREHLERYQEYPTAQRLLKIGEKILWTKNKAG